MRSFGFVLAGARLRVDVSVFPTADSSFPISSHDGARQKNSVPVKDVRRSRRPLVKAAGIHLPGGPQGYQPLVMVRIPERPCFVRRAADRETLLLRRGLGGVDARPEAGQAW